MMTSLKVLFPAVLFLVFVAPHACADDKLTAQDILQHHLDSIGTSAVRLATKSRVVEATASYRVLQGGGLGLSGRLGTTPVPSSVQYEGKAVIVSDGTKLHMLLKTNAPDYTGERFKNDGQRTSIEATYANKTRSGLGSLLESDDIPIREGLLGGVLTTAWPLFDLDARKGKLHYQGIKKVQGADFYVVSYHPAHRTGFEITLYFEPETFHHVRTVYEQERATQISTIDSMNPPARRSSRGLEGPDARSARNAPTRWMIDEEFGDFNTVDGLTLPGHYDLRYQLQVQGGLTTTMQWDVITTRLLNNVPVDPRNFQIQ